MPDTDSSTTVVASFDDREQAERAIEELLRLDFGADQIGFVVCSPEPPPRLDDSEECTLTSPVIGGGLLGCALGVLATGMIPGVGPAIASGLLIGMVGGAAGGLVGALGRIGVHESRAQPYQRVLESGRAIVAVKAGDRAEEAGDILHAYSPFDEQQTDSTIPPTCS